MENVIEGLRELVRVVLIAVIPVVYLSLEEGEVNWEAIGIVAVIAGLRGVEKWLHEKKSRFQLPV